MVVVRGTSEMENTKFPLSVLTRKKEKDKYVTEPCRSELLSTVEGPAPLPSGLV